MLNNILISCFVSSFFPTWHTFKVPFTLPTSLSRLTVRKLRVSFFEQLTHSGSTRRLLMEESGTWVLTLQWVLNLPSWKSRISWAGLGWRQERGDYIQTYTENKILIVNLLSLESVRLWSNNFTNILIRSSKNPKRSRKLSLWEIAYSAQELSLEEENLG